MLTSSWLDAARVQPDAPTFSLFTRLVSFPHRALIPPRHVWSAISCCVRRMSGSCLSVTHAVRAACRPSSDTAAEAG